MYMNDGGKKELFVENCFSRSSIVISHITFWFWELGFPQTSHIDFTSLCCYVPYWCGLHNRWYYFHYVHKYYIIVHLLSRHQLSVLSFLYKIERDMMGLTTFIPLSNLVEHSKSLSSILEYKCEVFHFNIWEIHTNV